jgi:hypothetical protein
LLILSLRDALLVDWKKVVWPLGEGSRVSSASDLRIGLGSVSGVGGMTWVVITGSIFPVTRFEVRRTLSGVGQCEL